MNARKSLPGSVTALSQGLVFPAAIAYETEDDQPKHLLSQFKQQTSAAIDRRKRFLRTQTN